MQQIWSVILPLKLGQHIGHNHPALHGPVDRAVVLEQSKHVPAVLHSQASDQFLNHLHTEKKWNTSTIRMLHHKVPHAILIKRNICSSTLFSVRCKAQEDFSPSIGRAKNVLMLYNCMIFVITCVGTVFNSESTDI